MTSPAGVPLAAYIDGHGTYGVRFHCHACLDSFDVPIAQVVERLKASGRGDEETGIKAVAWLATKPCQRCGATDWETLPALGPRPPRGAR